MRIKLFKISINTYKSYQKNISTIKQVYSILFSIITYNIINTITLLLLKNKLVFELYPLF